MVVCAHVIPGLERQRHAEPYSSLVASQPSLRCEFQDNRSLVTHRGWHLTNLWLSSYIHTLNWSEYQRCELTSKVMFFFFNWSSWCQALRDPSG